ncbi:YitT family protein [Erysipelothrix sp. HDW6C]|uniref:YitT family protein n=1 Tax=Erysipelothrix sp. HDW6C TaxID=2714930 RepID=UPI0014099BAF|nr:YitT family protein [Erysipelothrix sp. HDW6C]QIK69224.1 YitT family protein [Erysipelothrix sp. HDW6C]
MNNIKRYTYVIVGSFLFALSVNVFLIPASIYNGGMTGIAQLLRDAFVSTFNLKLNFDIAGMLSMALNIPIFIFAWSRLSKKFVQLSLLSIITQTIALTLIPIPEKPIVADVFIAIVLAGVLGSFGSSLTFRAKGSSGGLDVIGFYRSQNNKGSIGSIYLVINSVIYIICMVVYDLQTALYSLVYSYIFSFGLDKFHEHNLEASVMVFTKNKEIKSLVISEIVRGVTHWEGFGAYTGTSLDVFVTIVAQSEIADIKRLIKKHDPKAFIIVTKNLKVDGGFEKRLI